jgi:tyrosine-protein phosphatase YwqE
MNYWTRKEKMFFKKQNKNVIPDFSLLGADMHSHLIPGIDDGSPDMSTSLKLVNGMMELGYKKLITTPHIMSDIYPNTRTLILEKLANLKNAVKEKGWQVEIVAAAEYFLDDHVADLLKNKETLLTISRNIVLTEFSMASPSFGFKDILFDMQMQGYQPVIAHPERYIYLEHGRAFFDELKTTGCYFQLNILSLIGYYGKTVQNIAEYLIKKEYYELVGTDLHHLQHLTALHNPDLTAPLKKLLDSGKIINNRL